MSSEMFKTYWIRPGYAPLQKKKSEKVKVGTRMVQKKKGMFSSEMIEVEEDIFETKTSWVKTGEYSDTQIDVEDLAQKIQDACNDYWADGYELVQMVDTLKGRYDAKTNVNSGQQGFTWAWAYGYGYSVTDGVVLLFRKRVASQA